MLIRALPGIAVAAVALAALLVVLAVDAPSPEADAGQLRAGRAVYATHCAACHGSSLGGGTGPALNRSGLEQRYRTALDLLEYIRLRMPVDGVGPGGLSDADYLAVTAVILAERGTRFEGALDQAASADLVLGPVATAEPAAGPAPTAAMRADIPAPTRAASGNTPPQAPGLLEPGPAVLWRGPSPFFLTMQTSGLADADPGDRHTATEFEIRQLDKFRRVWAATVTSAPLDQATLERGAFTGSLSGHMGLKHDTTYILRARHRDGSGDALSEWSAWSAPLLFRTVPPGGDSPRPLRLRDIQPQSLRWETRDGAPVAVGDGNTLLITGVAGQLHEITGASRINDVRDFAPAERYMSVFLSFQAGPAGLELPESTLSFLDATGVRRFVWLPWIKLDPGAVLIGAPTAAGAFHFEPDDSLANPGDTEPDLFDYSRVRSPAMPWRVAEGFRVELVAEGLTLPVQIAAAPAPAADPDAPVAYITELQGTVKALGRDGSVWTYAANLLNQQLDDPPSTLEGEAGTSGVAVDPATGDLYVTTIYRQGDELFNKIVRLESDDGGRTAARVVDLLRMEGEATGTSHQIHGVIVGHDGMLYVAVGDGWNDNFRAADDAFFAGKVLRLRPDGRAPEDNPHFDRANPNAPVSYQWAKGLRNVFALAQRPGDDAVYLAENGVSIDRLLRVEAGDDHAYPFEDGSPEQRGLMFFEPSIAAVGTTFAIGGSFPADRQGRLYLGGFGWPWRQGTLDVGKEIWEIELDAFGAVARPPEVFVKYVGDGFASVAGVAYLDDGLYFVDFFSDHPPPDNPAASGARLWRVVPDAR